MELEFEERTGVFFKGALGVSSQLFLVMKYLDEETSFMEQGTSGWSLGLASSVQGRHTWLRGKAFLPSGGRQNEACGFPGKEPLDSYILSCCCFLDARPLLKYCRCQVRSLVRAALGMFRVPGACSSPDMATSLRSRHSFSSAGVSPKQRSDSSFQGQCPHLLCC